MGEERKQKKKRGALNRDSKGKEVIRDLEEKPRASTTEEDRKGGP